jgi:hypothetical protein
MALLGQEGAQKDYYYYYYVVPQQLMHELPQLPAALPAAKCKACTLGYPQCMNWP